MIDFDTINNFIIKAFVEKKEYFIRKKFDAYNLIIINKNSLLDENERVNKETKLLSITI